MFTNIIKLEIYYELENTVYTENIRVIPFCVNPAFVLLQLTCSTKSGLLFTSSYFNKFSFWTKKPIITKIIINIIYNLVEY